MKNCKPYNVHYTVYTIQYTLNIHYTEYTVYCMMYLNRVKFSAKQLILYMVEMHLQVDLCTIAGSDVLQGKTVVTTYILLVKWPPWHKL